MATKEEQRADFIKSVLSGDYLGNDVGQTIVLAQMMAGTGQLDQINTNMLSFEESYGPGKARNWMVKTWAKKNYNKEFPVDEDGEFNLVKFFDSNPELKACVEYSNYIKDYFQEKLQSTDLSDVRAIGELITEYQKMRSETGFDPERDGEYQEFLKQKEGDMARPPEMTHK